MEKYLKEEIKELNAYEVINREHRVRFEYRWFWQY